MKRFGNSTAFCSLILLGAAGCSSDSEVDIGDARTGERLTDYAATWEGYAEAYAFSDGSDKVRLELDSQGRGTLQVGDSPLVALDAEAGSKPPGFSQRSVGAGPQYPIEANVQEKRLRFQANPEDGFRDWCEAQPPVLYAAEHPGAYSCSPRVSLQGLADTSEICEVIGSGETVYCLAPATCWFVCECTEHRCTSEGDPVEKAWKLEAFGLLTGSSPQTLFDGVLTDGGETLEGTLVMMDQPITLRLQRQ